MQQSNGSMSKPRFVALIGARTHHQTAIDRPSGELLHIEPVVSVAELTLPVLVAADVFLVWDEDKAISQLKSRLATVESRSPVVAIGEQPSVRQVARALVAGAVDFLEWPCSSRALVAAVTSAAQTAAQTLPLKERAIEARRLLERLSDRERQVLAAMAQGMSNKAIAEMLEITPLTVDGHRKDLLSKIEVDHSAEAIRLELEASPISEWDGQSDWMAPWRIDTRRTIAS